MTQFNKLERQLAKTLSRFPYAKRMVKDIYGRVMYFVNKKGFKSKFSGRIKSYIGGGQESFFGYYDRSPESLDGYILSYLLNGGSTSKKPNCDEPIMLAVFPPDGEEPIYALPISSYNWQQGARAQWVSKDLFMVNDYDKEHHRYVSRLVSKQDFSVKRIYDYPVQDAFSTKFFLSVNYRRLATLRPDYGYTNMRLLNERELRDLSGDGIWRIDFETGEGRLIVSLKSLCDMSPNPDFSAAYHKVNHVMISPHGDKFIFLHRMVLDGRRFDRLVLADSERGEVKILNNSGMVSHCTWVDNETLVGYMRSPDGHDGYWVVNVQAASFERFADGRLDCYGDGHPHANGDMFVTDTYPDKARMQKLILANWRTGEINEIGEFYHGFEYKAECRCDLHPRLSPDGRRVYFDSVFDGKRRLYRLDLIS